MDRERKKRREAIVEGQTIGHRHARLEQLLFEELSAILRDEIRDRALEDVRFVRVELSIDYANARVVYRAPEPRTAEKSLARASGLFRAKIADALDLKRVPQLRFVPEAPDQFA